MKTQNHQQGRNLALIRQILAERPDVYYLIAWARVLHREHRSGRLSLDPQELDHNGVTAGTIKLAAELLSEVAEGGGL